MNDEFIRGLLDDASMFPPGSLRLGDAVPAHAQHRRAWYRAYVGSFVCGIGRIESLQQRLDTAGMESIGVAIVVSDGPDALERAMQRAAACPSVRVTAIELPVEARRLATTIPQLRGYATDECSVYVEVPIELVTDDHVHRLSESGLRLKLRTGGTTLDAFRPEAVLARPIVLAAAERLPFKCTAGLHHAVRQVDRATGFEHHGFLNVLLAARVAAATGSVDATAAILGLRDRVSIAARVRDLAPHDVRAARALFASFGTCSIAEPLADLVALRLIHAT